MNDEKKLVWVLRLFSVSAIMVPLVFYYLSSESLSTFFTPVFTPFNPNLHFQITSMEFDDVGGNMYVLRIGLVNTGNMEIGLKKMDGRIDVPSFNFGGRLLLQSPLTLPPAGGDELRILFTLGKGDPSDFQRIFTERPMMSLSGNATVILNSAEIPMAFSISIPSGD
ncbi:MAG: hypothetical protein ACUVQY_04415 [Thermoproteota archaeon]